MSTGHIHPECGPSTFAQERGRAYSTVAGVQDLLQIQTFT